MSNEQQTPQAGPGQTLFRLVRFWARRWTGAGEAIDPDRGRDVMVTEAVKSLQTGVGATVNDVAHELGIDQSGASRFITQAVARGYLRKITSAKDARHRVLVVTDEGNALLDSAHQWQETIFSELTAGWPDADIEHLHRLMGRLVESQRRG